MFKLILIVGWTLFFVGLLLAFVFPTRVLPHFGLPLIVLGILLGVSSF